MEHEAAIAVTGLAKSYGEVAVLDDVDIEVQGGSVFSLLGPNGAGKTTTVQILATLVKPDGGSARVAGFDVAHEPRQVRRRISLTGQYAAIDELQTGEENLRMMARLLGLRGKHIALRSQELLERFDLTGAARRLVKTYSGGMRRRLDLAASLVGTPSVLFLDEPTTGLDVRSRQAMWEVVTGLAYSGVTVFLTTQYLEEADKLADQVAVLDGGRIVAAGAPELLKEQVGEQRLDLTLANAAVFAEARAVLGNRSVLADPDALTIGVATDGTAAHVRALLDEVDPDRDHVTRFVTHAATLDDVFVALTGHAGTARTAETEPAHA